MRENSTLTAWSPRSELVNRLPALWREVVADIGLLIRARLALTFGSQAECSRVLDRLIVRDESRARRCR